MKLHGREFKTGQTIADALLAHGIKTCRQTRGQNPRGVFCGMGICFECRMIVNGIPNVRTCMTPAAPGTIVVSQNDGEVQVIK